MSRNFSKMPDSNSDETRKRPLTIPYPLETAIAQINTTTLHYTLEKEKTQKNIQLWTFAYVRLLNKPYENEVTFRGQNIPLKCCQPLELLMCIETGEGLDLIQ